MIRSMTGFGEVQREAAGGLISVQVRTVNHRHFHTHFRLPLGAERWEGEITQILREKISRGHVHYRLDFLAAPESEQPVQVDHDRVSAYLAALNEMKKKHRLAGEVDIALVARFGDIFQATLEESEQIAFDDVAAATRGALDMAVAARDSEGAALGRDLAGSLDSVETAVDAISARAPERLIKERDRLRTAVRELSGDAEVDEERLAREVAYLAERWDINEEIVRLRSHLAQVRELIGADVAEPVGKRLGFWVQEMQREANTLGAKANDAEIGGHVVEMKTAVEKLREQVENVE